MSNEVVVIGAGGHGKVVADIVMQRGDHVRGFLDDDLRPQERILDIPVLGPVDTFEKYREDSFIIAIGDAEVRKRISEAMGYVKWYTAIHPKAAVSVIDTEIGAGTVIMANTVVNTGTKIGVHCIVNSGAVVEHDAHIGNYVHISVGAKLGGCVSIENSTWIGIGATVSNNISVCGGSMIGAGCVVVKNIIEPGIYVGVPAKRMC